MRAVPIVRNVYSFIEGILAWLEETLASRLVPTLARLVFAGVLLGYYWASAYTKIGDGLFGFLFPTVGAYAQIFPLAMESAGFDPSKLSIFHTLVVLAGTWAELILPFLVVVGLLTRLAALGMIGFVLVQSYVDIVGHDLSAKAAGAWFDRASDSLIADQRAFWIFLLIVLVLRGAGPISLDRLFSREWFQELIRPRE